MRIDKITKNTKSFTNEYVRFWIAETGNVIEAAYITEAFPKDTPIEKLNDFIFERLDEDFFVEDRGDYWELLDGPTDEEGIIEEDMDNDTPDDYIIECIQKLVDTREKQMYGEHYELSISGDNIVDAVIKLRDSDGEEKDFYIRNNYTKVSALLSGEFDVIYSLAEKIYNYIIQVY